MLPEKTGFRYPNERLEYSLRRMLDDITVCCDGRKLRFPPLFRMRTEIILRKICSYFWRMLLHPIR